MASVNLKSKIVHHCSLSLFASDAYKIRNFLISLTLVTFLFPSGKIQNKENTKALLEGFKTF